MQLGEFKTMWSLLPDVKKLDIIRTSNERRVQAFEIKKSKQVASTVKSAKKKGRKSTKRVSKKADMQTILETMTEEEKENLRLILTTMKK